MKEIIKHFCEDEGLNNGLFLLDMPTGFGKTHNVLDYIFESATTKGFDKRIFFVTTLKKNLPVNELKDRFIETGLENEFKEKFIFLDSNVDCVVNNLTLDLINTIPNEIKKSEEYKKFEADARFVQKFKTKTSYDEKSICKRVTEELRTKSERIFRRYISDLLSKEFKTVNEKLQAIKTTKKWQWLGRLYPAVFTRDKKIIFLSADKFISRNSTIVEPSYMFYNNEILNNSIVFIDEFDAVKETMLKSIINNSIKDKVDFLELFKEIYSALHTSVFPVAMTKPSQKRLNSKYADQDPTEIIDRIRQESEEIYNEYNLKCNHKTKFIESEINKNFLFQDYRFHSITNDNKNFITTQYESSKKINEIDFVSKKPENETSNIYNLLGRLRGFITYFQGTINILAYNYLELKEEERKNGEDEFTREAAIRTILNEFHIKAKYVDYLTSSILVSSYKNRDLIEKNSDYDLSVYEKGFRYYSFINDINHDMQSKIMMCNFSSTPEKLLLRFCDKAKVIGISATATLPTVIGNFDIDYLQLKLQDKFKIINKSEANRLKKGFEENCRGYEQIEIKADLISGTDSYGMYSYGVWHEIFEDAELAKYAYDTIEQLRVDEYCKIRYVRIIKAFKKFVIHTDIQSFLCMLTIHPKNVPEMDKKTLNKLFDLICNEHKDLLPKSFSIGKNVEMLDGEEFDNKKDSIVKKLSNNEKVFIISVYQTVGAGQNLQYSINPDVEKQLIKTNDFPSRHEKDFDAIYLDKPTNIITNLCNSISEEDFVKYIFQHELMQQNGEISQSDNINHIKKAFNCFITQNSFNLPFAKSDSNNKSYKLYATRTLIQAIGRICRTNLKNKTIHIYADEAIQDVIEPTVANRLLNKEFLALLDCCNVSERSSNDSESLLFSANIKADRVNTFIKNFLINNWNLQSKEQWMELRNIVLKYPTVSKEIVSNNIFLKNFYIELPCKHNAIYYSQRGDYSTNHISFSRTNECHQAVSQDDVRLKKLISIPNVKKCFDERGWATEFKPNDFIMAPAVYNNIYKGAIGEVVGWILFKDLLGIKLESIKNIDLFELFDYQYGNDIFVDFKHWKETFDQENDKMIKKINDKLGKCNGRAVFIINILSSNKYDVRKISVSNGTIYSIPSFYINEEPNIDAIDYIRRKINELSD